MYQFDIETLRAMYAAAYEEANAINEGAGNRALSDTEAKRFSELKSIMDGINNVIEQRAEAAKQKFASGDVTYLGDDIAAKINSAVEDRKMKNGGGAGEQFADYLRTGRMQFGLVTGASGVVVPDVSYGGYLSVLKRYGGVLRGSKLIQTDRAAPLPIPVFNNTATNAAATAEGGTLSTEATVTVANAELRGIGYRSHIYKVSGELVASADFDVQAAMLGFCGESTGRALEADLVNGDGTNKARGFLQDATDSTIETAGEGFVSYNDLLGLYHSVDPAYREDENGNKVAAWIMADATLKIIYGLVDDMDRPIFVGPSEDRPASLMGHPVIISNSMPTGAESKCIAFGDFANRFFVRIAKRVEAKRLVETYVSTNEIGFQTVTYADSKLVDANAVKYLKMGAGGS